MIGPRSAVRDHLATAQELLAFMWRGKAWWLTPVVVFLLLMGAVLFLVESSAVAPFIYVLF